MHDHVSDNLIRALNARWACWRAGSARTLLEARHAATERKRDVTRAVGYGLGDGLFHDPLDDLDPYARLNWYMFEYRRERGDHRKLGRLSFAPLLVVDLGLTTEYTRTLARVFNTTAWRDPASFAAFNNILDAVVAEDRRLRGAVAGPGPAVVR